jgi:hypothetical protein
MSTLRAFKAQADQPLLFQLWWFIENVTEDDPFRTEIFFQLREKIQAKQHRDSQPLRPWQQDVVSVWEAGADITCLADANSLAAVLLELDPSEGCESVDEASRRLNTIMNDVSSAFEKVDPLA